MKYIFSLSVLVCFLLFNCKSQMPPKEPSSTSETAFVGTKWVLTKLNGDVLNLSKTELEQPYIKLSSKDNGIGGNGGCNSFGGTYILKDNQQIEFSQMMATMRYCEGSSIENVFMSNLKKAVSYTITDGELTFVDENGYILASFEPSTDKNAN
ncbi:META domain-containing protein [Gelidibacter maritimus]|uniref:META domain-containing protein n=1 Tax=Gelidibacter maritimus TaxID=2761487 RepID=A0A7W2R2R7_9FLAO|nr:META domain-containing protein [Gelidibacter maritimus]MBA6152096.1 META domain-containing protein [Gelidibacter maritimus]